MALITGAAAGQGAAELVLFLASERSSFISGAEISIDGGYIAAFVRRGRPPGLPDLPFWNRLSTGGLP